MYTGLQGVRTLCTVLSDLGGGHDVNLRDKCGASDDVTGRRGWMGRSRGRGRSI